MGASRGACGVACGLGGAVAREGRLNLGGLTGLRGLQAVCVDRAVAADLVTVRPMYVLVRSVSWRLACKVARL